MLSWTSACRHGNYEHAPPVAALKSFIMSSWMDLKATETVVDQVLDARKEMAVFTG